MAIVPIIPVQTARQTVGRSGPITKIVIHEYDGELEQLDTIHRLRLRPAELPGCKSSFHYGVDECFIHQFVDTNNTSWSITPSGNCGPSGNVPANDRAIHIAYCTGYSQVYPYSSPNSYRRLDCLAALLTNILILYSLTPADIVVYTGDLIDLDLPIMLLPLVGNTNVLPPPAPAALTVTRVGVALTNALFVEWDVVFNTPVTGVNVGDFSLIGSGDQATASLTSVNGSGTTYRVRVNTIFGSGNLILNLNDNDSIINGSGTPLGVGLAGGVNQTFQINRTQVTAVIATTSLSPTNDNPIPITISFSRPITNLTVDDLATANGEVVGLSGDGQFFTANFIPTGPGIVAVVLSGVAVFDAFGNSNIISNLPSLTYDPIQPTVTVISNIGQDVSNSIINFTALFSKPVTGFNLGDVVLSGTAGASSVVITGFGTTYNVAVSGQGATGTIIVTASANTVLDASGNTNTAGVSIPFNYVQPAADSGLFSELSIFGSTGFTDEYYIGNFVDFLGNVQALNTSRISLSGPYEITEDGAFSVVSFEATITAAGKARATVFRDNGNTVDIGLTPISSPVLTESGRPLVHVLTGPETNVAIGGINQQYDLPLIGTVTTPGFYWLGIISDTTLAGNLKRLANTSKTFIRTNNANYTYHPTNLPGNFPTGGSTTSSLGAEIKLWANFTPTMAIAPSSVTPTNNGDRSVALTWVNTDPRVQGYQIERRKAAGPWVVIGVSPKIPFIDTYLETGISYTYRVANRYRTGTSTYGTSSAIIVAGVSPVYADGVGTMLGDTVYYDRTQLGAIRFQGNTMPGSIVARSGYARTDFNWIDLNPSPGVYTPAAIDSFLANEASNGRIGNFRIRCSVPGAGRQVPNFITGGATASDGTYYADFNNVTTLNAMLALIDYLGNRYQNDVRVGSIDHGIIDDFGEWRGVRSGGLSPSVANKKVILSRWNTAMPTRPMIFSQPEVNDLIEYAFSLSPIVGTRADSLGHSDGFFDLTNYHSRSESVRRQIHSYERARYMEHLNSATLAAEPGWPQRSLDAVKRHRITAVINTNTSGYGSLSGPDQVRVIEAFAVSGARIVAQKWRFPASVINGSTLRSAIYWANRGYGGIPTSDAWIVKIQIRSTLGDLLWQGNSSVDIRKVWPTRSVYGDHTSAYVVTDNLIVTGVPAGTHKVGVSIPGFRTNMPYLKLGQTGEVNGFYPMSDITVS